MATLGRWTGGTTTLVPTTSWAAPNGLFTTQARNDSSAYSWASTTSTLTLPSSGLADGYLIVAFFQFDSTSADRVNLESKIVQASGTGNFVGGETTGYSRITSNERSYNKCFAFVDNPSASATFQLQWKANDYSVSPTGGTSLSSIEVIPLYYTSCSIYTSSSSEIYGGYTRNKVGGWSSVVEGNVEMVNDGQLILPEGRKYLLLGSQYLDGFLDRTHRFMGFRVDDTVDHARTYAYARTTGANTLGGAFGTIVDATSQESYAWQFCYAGDGMSAGQGGAEWDGVTTAGSHTCVAIELALDAEAIATRDTTGNTTVNTTGPIDLNLATTVDFNDSAAFTKASNSAINAEKAMDVLFFGNVTAAQETVDNTATGRWAAALNATVNGTEDTNTTHGNIMRNQDVTPRGLASYGWGANIMNFIGVSSGDDLGLSVTEYFNDATGGIIQVQPGWIGAAVLNLDSLTDDRQVKSVGDYIQVDYPDENYTYAQVEANREDENLNTLFKYPQQADNYGLTIGDFDTLAASAFGYVPVAHAMTAGLELSDTLLPLVAETFAILLSLGRSDELLISGTEGTSQLNVFLSRAETLLPTVLDEMGTILSSSSRSDEILPLLQESMDILSYLTRSDDLLPLLDDVKALTNQFSATDVLRPKIDELLVLLSRSSRADELLPAIAEARSIASTSNRGEDITLAVLDDLQALVSVSRTDELLPLLDDIQAVTAKFSASDELLPYFTELAEILWLTLEAFRWRNDDGSESAASWARSQDTAIVRAKNVVTRLRVLLDTNSDAPALQLKLQYRPVGDPDWEWRDVE